MRPIIKTAMKGSIRKTGISGTVLLLIDRGNTDVETFKTMSSSLGMTV